MFVSVNVTVSVRVKGAVETNTLSATTVDNTCKKNYESARALITRDVNYRYKTQIETVTLTSNVGETAVVLMN